MSNAHVPNDHRCTCDDNMVCVHFPTPCDDDCSCVYYATLEAFVRAWDALRKGGTKGPNHAKWKRKKAALLDLRAIIGERVR